MKNADFPRLQESRFPRSVTKALSSRSNVVNFGFFTERCRTPCWRRSVRFSNLRVAPVLKTDDRPVNNVPSQHGRSEVTDSSQALSSQILRNLREAHIEPANEC